MAYGPRTNLNPNGSVSAPRTSTRFAVPVEQLICHDCVACCLHTVHQAYCWVLFQLQW